MRKKFSLFAREHIIIFSIIFAVLILAIQFMLTKILILGGENPEKRIYGVADIIVMLVPTVIVCITAILIGLKSKFIPAIKNLGKGLLAGLPFMLIGIYAAVSIIVDVGISEISFPGIFRIITFMISMLLIGLLEEFLCRGVILNMMLEKWGNTKKGILKSAILSSLIFGLAHLVTLFVYPHLVVSAVSQVLYASFVGFYFACIYIRCKNLYSLVIIHAFFDACSLQINILYLPAMLEVINPVDVSLTDGLSTIILWIPFIFFGLLLTRKRAPAAEHTESV